MICLVIGHCDSTALFYVLNMFLLQLENDRVVLSLLMVQLQVVAAPQRSLLENTGHLSEIGLRKW